MSNTVLRTLSALRDVDGVVGSFVVGAEGTLLARDLPEMFADGLLNEIGPRIRRVADGLSETGENPGSVVLHFGDHKLWLKPAEHFTLCVLGGLQVNRPALRMALTLVSRSVGPLLLQPGAETAFSTFVTPPPPTTISSRAPETLVSSKPPSLHRGRPIDD